MDLKKGKIRLLGQHLSFPAYMTLYLSGLSYGTEGVILHYKIELLATRDIL